MVVVFVGSMAKPKIPHTTTTTATTTNTTTTNARPFSCSSLHLKIWAIALLSFATSLFIVSRLLSNTNNVRSSWPADCLLQTLMEFNGGDTHSMEGLHGNNAAQMNRHGEHSSLAEHVGALVIRNGDPKEESRVFTGDLRVMEEAWNKLCFGEPPRHERLRLAVFVKKWPVGGVPGGLERHALTLHKVLATWGHTVHVYTMSPDISSNGTTSVVDGTLSVHFFPPTVNNNFDFATALAAFVEQNRRQADHASKRLRLVEANISKITEFGLSLNGQAASWYLQNEISEFADFDQLRQEFVQLFHRRIPQRDLMSQFYAILQEANETVP